MAHTETDCIIIKPFNKLIQYSQTLKNITHFKSYKYCIIQSLGCQIIYELQSCEFLSWWKPYLKIKLPSNIILNGLQFHIFKSWYLKCEKILFCKHIIPLYINEEQLSGLCLTCHICVVQYHKVFCNGDLKGWLSVQSMVGVNAYALWSYSMFHAIHCMPVTSCQAVSHIVIYLKGNLSLLQVFSWQILQLICHVLEKREIPLVPCLSLFANCLHILIFFDFHTNYQ